MPDDCLGGPCGLDLAPAPCPAHLLLIIIIRCLQLLQRLRLILRLALRGGHLRGAGHLLFVLLAAGSHPGGQAAKG